MTPLWRPKRTRRLAAASVFGQLPMAADAGVGLVGSVQPAGAGLLRVGMFNTLDLIGAGPGGGPVYRMNGGIPSPGNVNGLIAQANLVDNTLVLRLAGDKNAYAPGGVYNEANYFAQVDAYRGNAIFTAALAAPTRRVVIYLIDEPFHPTNYTNSMTPTAVNRMGLHCKANWPGCITMVRASGTFMRFGWKGLPLPAGGWTGVDYGWSQFESNHVPSAGETPAAFFTREKSDLLAVNLGMIPGLNLWDGGNYTVLAGVQPCWDARGNGSSSGLIKGTFSGVAPGGSFIACGDPSVGGVETRFTANPALLRAIADVISADTAAPFAGLWTHIYPGFQSPAEEAAFGAIEVRPDYAGPLGLGYFVTKCASRTIFGGYRAAK